MGKPFEVTVMHDVPERKKEDPYQEAIQHVSDDAGEMAVAIASTDVVPSKEEVMESIESLRPNTAAMDDEQYKALANSLDQAYNTKQLSMYLGESLNLSSIDAESVQVMPKPRASRKGGFQRSAWQIGTTPLSERHSGGTTVSKGDIGRSKATLITQILHFAWNLVNTTEWQYPGELEIKMKSWQLSYLLDLRVQNIPMYQTFINCSLQRDSYDIRAYRPDNVVRITARRFDAEQIADEIEQGIQMLRNIKMDLTAVEALFGRDARHNTAQRFLSSRVSVNIARRTTTAFELAQDNLIIIHGASNECLRTARRALYSVLDIPSGPPVGTVRPYGRSPNYELNHASEASQVQLLALEQDRAELHLRYLGRGLGRLVNPSYSSLSRDERLGNGADGSPAASSRFYAPYTEDSPLERSHSREAAARHLADLLHRSKRDLPGHGTPTSDTSALWSRSMPLRPTRWRAQFCRLLRPMPDEVVEHPFVETVWQTDADRQKVVQSRIEQLSRGLTRRTSILQEKVPHTTALLSYFSLSPQSSPSVKAPFFVAHFTPSPMGKTTVSELRGLPRIELYYQSVKNIIPVSVQARFASQEVRVPLPGEAVDLRFARDYRLNFTSMQNIKKLGLSRFTKALKNAVAAGKPIEPQSIHKIKVPAWMVWMLDMNPDKPPPGVGDVAVEYMFDRFELVQAMEAYPPMPDEQAQRDMTDPMLQELVGSMVPGTYLKHRDIDGGYLGGQRSELTLAISGTPDEQAVMRTQSETTLDLVRTAFGIAQAITRLGSGESKPARIGGGDDQGSS